MGCDRVLTCCLVQHAMSHVLHDTTTQKMCLTRQLCVSIPHHISLCNPIFNNSKKLEYHYNYEPKFGMEYVFIRLRHFNEMKL